MSGREIAVAGRRVWLAETGNGPPLLYLHGIADIHGAAAGWLPFHQALARGSAVTAPAHPGCAGTDENEGIDAIDDVVFHYLEVLDALGLERFDLAGSCIGGWIAAEIAVRHPERVRRLALLGATGLFVSGQPIADIFWQALPANGVELGGLRHLLFADADDTVATALFPDGRGDIDQEILRFKTFRFASRVGFKPPYLHSRKLRERLARFRGPALVVWGADDHLVPRAHAEAYAAGLAGAELRVIDGAGHSLAAERPDETADLVVSFLAG